MSRTSGACTRLSSVLTSPDAQTPHPPDPRGNNKEILSPFHTSSLNTTTRDAPECRNNHGGQDARRDPLIHPSQGDEQDDVPDNTQGNAARRGVDAVLRGHKRGRSDSTLRASALSKQKVQARKRRVRNKMALLAKESLSKEYDLPRLPEFPDAPERSRSDAKFMTDLHKFGNATPKRHFFSDEDLERVTKANSKSAAEEVLDSIRQQPVDVSFIPAIEPDKQTHMLKEKLRTWFSVIVIHPPPGFVPKWSIKEQIQSLGDRHGQAYKPNEPLGPGGEPTKNISIDEVRDIFMPRDKGIGGDDIGFHEDEQGVGLCKIAINAGVNILNMANESSKIFVPIEELCEIDLLYRMKMKTKTKHTTFGRHTEPPPRRGKANLADEIKALPDFMILTTAGSVSSFHADHAGQVTCIVGVEGKKVWYIPRGSWSSTRTDFSHVGTYGVHWERGVFRVDVRPGVVLIQEPGTPHAVITPEDSLIAGVFFYTAQHFARSIECIRHTLSDPEQLITNDDMKAENWANLTLIVNQLDDEEFFNDDQRSEIRLEIEELLIVCDWRIDGGTSFGRPGAKRISKLTRKPSSDEEPTALGNELRANRNELIGFLDACAMWVQSRKQPEWVD